jgi:hypothetical protein
MKRKGFDEYELDKGEPALRSCWECNSAHGHLKDVSFLHVCVVCDRTWIFGRFLDSFASNEEFDAFMVEHLGKAEGEKVAEDETEPEEEA